MQKIQKPPPFMQAKNNQREDAKMAARKKMAAQRLAKFKGGKGAEFKGQNPKEK